MKKTFITTLAVILTSSILLSSEIIPTSAATKNASQVTSSTSQLDVGKGIQWPLQAFAPYVDATRGVEYPLDRKVQDLGIKYFTLGFILADENGNPSWTGSSYGNIQTNPINVAIKKARSLGADVRISFGGAAGTELALASSTVSNLQSKYQQVIEAYDVTQVDFDIEGSATYDTNSIERRSQAIANLQKLYKQQGNDLKVWLTLPVMPEGLTQSGKNVAGSAVKNGVDLAGVNIMAMDYGSSYTGNMGDYAVQAMNNLQIQLKQIYTANGQGLSDVEAWKKVGVTPMIGVNDVREEIFYLTDANKVLTFARQKNIGYIGMWSLNRDDNPGQGSLSDYTGIQTEKNAFSKVFVPFSTGGTVPNPTDTQAPTVPTGVTSTGQTDTSISLKWNASTDNVGVQEYQIYRNNTKVGTTASLSYTDSNLQPNTSYTYIIKAVDAAGNGTDSSMLTVKTADKPSTTIPQWDASKQYNTGDIVLYKGLSYRAKWWSQNFPPDTQVDHEWDTPWEKYIVK